MERGYDLVNQAIVFLQLICPLLRCVGNLLSSCPVETLSSHMSDVRVVVALVALLQAYLQTQPALARECAWVLNNLTGLGSLHPAFSIFKFMKRIEVFFSSVSWIVKHVFYFWSSLIGSIIQTQ